MASVSDFIPEEQHFLASLVNSFPKEWKGVLAALNCQTFPVQKASTWLEEQYSSNKYVSDTLRPHWPKLIDNLVAEFPVVLDLNEVFFMPKILLLPLNVHRNLLGFIHYHSDAISLEYLDRLVRKLEEFRPPSDDTSWKNVLRELLKAEVRNKWLIDSVLEPQKRESEMAGKQEQRDPLVHVNIMSNKFEKKLTELCEKIDATNFGKATNCSVYSQNYWVLQNDLQENVPKPDWYEDGVILPADSVVSPGINVGQETSESAEEKGQQKQTEEIEILTPVKRPRKDLLDTEVEDLPSISSLPGHGAPEDRTSLLDASCIVGVELLGSCIQSLQTSSDYQITRVHDLPQALKLFVSCTTSEMEEICIFLGLAELPESVSVLLCQQFIDLMVEPSYGNATIFARHLILPRLQDLTEAASRILSETLCFFAKKHPRAFCDGVIIYLLPSVNFSASQADVINKVISDTFTADVVKSMLEKVLDTRSTLEGSSFNWSEEVVMVVLGVINLRLDIFDKSLFEKFACTLEKQVLSVGKSLKFPKLLLATITKYPNHVRLHHDLFQSILQNNDTFFKKAGIAALKKVMK